MILNQIINMFITNIEVSKTEYFLNQGDLISASERDLSVYNGTYCHRG